MEVFTSPGQGGQKMDILSISRPTMCVSARSSSWVDFEAAVEKPCDRQERKPKNVSGFSLLRRDKVESLKSTFVVLEGEQMPHFWRSRKDGIFLDGNETFKLDRMLVYRASKAEEESKESKGDEQTGITKNEQSNHLLKGEDGPTVQTRVQIFSSTLFWVFLFFMASIWNRENSFRGRRGGEGDRNNRL